LTDPNHEQFSRVRRLIGEAGVKRLAEAHVVVVGLGAVGGYAVEGLARAGVGHLRLVDFDQVTASNINRQLYALHSTVGQYKTDLACRRILDINPACQVEPMRCFAHEESFDAILSGPPNLVIDAIDAITPKVALLAEVTRRNIPLLSSMGAALRSDPSKIHVGPLSQARICPLAKRVRTFLRRRGASVDFPCVYSTEPIHELPEDAIAPVAESEEPVLQRGRKRRTLGSLPTITGIFGLTLANEALRVLAGEAFPKKNHP